jgi:hypothetical protein
VWSFIETSFEFSQKVLLLMQEQRFDRKRSIIPIESDLLANENLLNS